MRREEAGRRLGAATLRRSRDCVGVCVCVYFFCCCWRWCLVRVLVTCRFGHHSIVCVFLLGFLEYFQGCVFVLCVYPGNFCVGFIK